MKTLYTRIKDSSRGHKVHILPDRLELESPEGKKTFSSARQLLKSLKREAWSFDRYFRQGKYAPPQIEENENFWLPEKKLGIDLENRSHEVKKLLCAGFGSWIQSSGYSLEDVFQEVCKGIIARNNGKCPWDPNKSSFGHYVHMVCSGVMSNFHRKRKRIREVEQIGLPSLEGGKRSLEDVGSIPHPSKKSSEQMEIEVLEVQEDLISFISSKGDSTDGQIAIKVLPLLRQGYTRAEIASALGINLSTASRALSHLRARTREWMSSR